VSLNNEPNPLQKYVDELDNPPTYVQPVINPTHAQYLIKALDYLKIWSQEHDDVVEEIMLDIVALAPEP
jgi:hypothetical protein